MRPEPDAGTDLEVIRWARRVLYVAAALFVLGMLTAVGLLRPTDSGKLEATTQEVEQAMDELDARIRAAREEGR